MKKEILSYLFNRVEPDRPTDWNAREFAEEKDFPLPSVNTTMSLFLRQGLFEWDRRPHKNTGGTGRVWWGEREKVLAAFKKHFPDSPNLWEEAGKVSEAHQKVRGSNRPRREKKVCVQEILKHLLDDAKAGRSTEWNVKKFAGKNFPPTTVAVTMSRLVKQGAVIWDRDAQKHTSSTHRVWLGEKEYVVTAFKRHFPKSPELWAKAGEAADAQKEARRNRELWAQFETDQLRLYVRATAMWNAFFEGRRLSPEEVRKLNVNIRRYTDDMINIMKRRGVEWIWSEGKEPKEIKEEMKVRQSLIREANDNHEKLKFYAKGLTDQNPIKKTAQDLMELRTDLTIKERKLVADRIRSELRSTGVVGEEAERRIRNFLYTPQAKEMLRRIKPHWRSALGATLDDRDSQPPIRSNKGRERG